VPQHESKNLPTYTMSYSVSAVKIYKATSSLLRFENALPIFVKMNTYITFTVEKSRPKIWATSVNKRTVQK
jgi:hypothetical protein